MNTGIEQALITLIYTTIILLIIVSGFIVKTLMDWSNMAKSWQDLGTLLNHELEPAIKELKRALDNINVIATAADHQVGAIKNILSSAVSSAAGVVGKAKGFSVSFFEGILAGLKLFVSKRKK